MRETGETAAGDTCEINRTGETFETCESKIGETCEAGETFDRTR